MKPPAGLRPAGLAAWGGAQRALESHPDSDLLAESASRYAYAVDLADGAREAWLAQGRPLTVLWPNGIESPHPLLKVMRDAEHDAAKFAVALGIDARVRGRSGRRAEAVIEPKIGTSPAAKLRAVRDAGGESRGRQYDAPQSRWRPRSSTSKTRR